MKISMLNFFANVWQKLNELIAKLGFDDKVMNLYDQYYKDLAELFKWLIAIFLAIIFIIGIIGFIKKTFKLFIILAAIAAVIIFLL